MGRFRRDGLDAYLREVSRAPLLTPGEEAELGRRRERGDPAARDALVVANLRLVVYVARRMAGCSLPLDERVSEGNLGLIRAAERYDWRSGCRFSTYAVYWIRQAIGGADQDRVGPVRVPRNMFAVVSHWRKAAAALLAHAGSPPAAGEVSALLGMPPGLSARAARTARLLDSPGPDVAALSGVLAPDALGDDPSTPLLPLDGLDPREREAVAARYGLDGAAPQSLAAVGGRLGVSKEGARKIQKRALAKLRAAVALV